MKVAPMPPARRGLLLRRPRNPRVKPQGQARSAPQRTPHLSPLCPLLLDHPRRPRKPRHQLRRAHRRTPHLSPLSPLLLGHPRRPRLPPAPPKLRSPPRLQRQLMQARQRTPCLCPAPRKLRKPPKVQRPPRYLTLRPPELRQPALPSKLPTPQMWDPRQRHSPPRKLIWHLMRPHRWHPAWSQSLAQKARPKLVNAVARKTTRKV